MNNIIFNISIIKWYNDTDFILKDIKSDEISDIKSFKTQNGDGLKILKHGNSIDVLWDGNTYKKVMFIEEDRISVTHGDKYYYFTRVIEDDESDENE